MKMLIVVAGMAAVTYVPRMLPAVFMHRLQLPRWLQQWLKAVPYAALGALIFPGIMEVHAQEPAVGLLGGLVAGVLAFFRLHLVAVMAGAIAGVLLAGHVLV